MLMKEVSWSMLSKISALAVNHEREEKRLLSVLKVVLLSVQKLPVLEIVLPASGIKLYTLGSSVI